MCIEEGRQPRLQEPSLEALTPSKAWVNPPQGECRRPSSRLNGDERHHPKSSSTWPDRESLRVSSRPAQVSRLFSDHRVLFARHLCPAFVMREDLCADYCIKATLRSIYTSLLAVEHAAAKQITRDRAVDSSLVPCCKAMELRASQGLLRASKAY